MITQKELKKVLQYNQETGYFIWKHSKSGRRGDVAGGLASGYIHICINGKIYKAHRLAVLYVKGYFPEHGVDHKDRIKHHNWWDNLREATQQCNSRNRANPSNNTSTVKGVGWHKHSGKWYAQIVIGGKQTTIARNTNFDEAVCHRLAAEQCVDWAGCDSNSPAYQHVKGQIQ